MMAAKLRHTDAVKRQERGRGREREAEIKGRKAAADRLDVCVWGGRR